MVSASALLVVALGALSSASPLVPRVTCYPGVYIIAARGSYDGTRESEGQPGVVADMIEQAIKNKSGSVAVDYRATFLLGDYDKSLVEGINDAKSKVQDYVAACGSSSRIVLLGWSQGANVMTDLLAGGNKPDQPEVLAEQYRKNIVGVAAFADPSFTLNQTFNKGTHARGAENQWRFIQPRAGESLKTLQSYAKVLRSYCDTGDFFCDGVVNNNQTVHGTTVAKYAQNATDFIVKLAQQ